eukprot:TRINITY_DN3823_c0_g3_i4.p1 TRINITY_DN3823_c0_g3~~TRINITY_DN3823_c0_g3_i4.p1  ORF type:complete len:244 (-),score=36.39 TRINITY_DN3823_c0_g3_i4:584-1270(-)
MCIRDSINAEYMGITIIPAIKRKQKRMHKISENRKQPCRSISKPTPNEITFYGKTYTIRYLQFPKDNFLTLFVRGIFYSLCRSKTLDSVAEALKDTPFGVNKRREDIDEYAKDLAENCIKYLKGKEPSVKGEKSDVQRLCGYLAQEMNVHVNIVMPKNSEDGLRRTQIVDGCARDSNLLARVLYQSWEPNQIGIIYPKEKSPTKSRKENTDGSSKDSGRSRSCSSQMS